MKTKMIFTRANEKKNCLSLVVRFKFVVFELSSEPREKIVVYNIYLIDAMVSDLHCLISFLTEKVFFT